MFFHLFTQLPQLTPPSVQCSLFPTSFFFYTCDFSSIKEMLQTLSLSVVSQVSLALKTMDWPLLLRKKNASYEF